MKHLFLSLVLCILVAFKLNAQQHDLTLTIEEVIELAKSQSPEGIQAKHSFRASYWEFRSYRADFLPSLVFDASLPSFSRAFTRVQQNDGTFRYLQDFSNEISGSLSIRQNVALTGGQFAISSSLRRNDQLGDFRKTEYSSSIIGIRYSQSLFGVNTFKWTKKIEPLRYEEAKRGYLKAMEGVSTASIRYFFDLIAAQQAVAIAEFNKANTDTLFRIAHGRYNIGTIGENDLLQSELNYMNACATLNDAELNLGTAKNRLRSYLGYNESVNITLVIPDNVPSIQIDMDRIMSLAKQNNPQLLANERQLIEAERTVATEKANRGFVANLNLSYGLDQRGGNLADAFRDPQDMQTLQLGIQVPILDWGKGKGRVKMAQSNQELVRVKVAQNESDFEQDVMLQVNQFKIQSDQFKITAKADTIARERYSVSKERYLIDKITITDMNNAQNDRDYARQRYVSALRSYWSYYYGLRQITLYDIINQKELVVDYDILID